MAEFDLLDLYPRSKSPIDERGKLVTDEHLYIARQVGKEYFDGERRLIKGKLLVGTLGGETRPSRDIPLFVDQYLSGKVEA